jgi:hypothetical protein
MRIVRPVLAVAAIVATSTPVTAGASLRPQGSSDSVLHLSRAPYVAVHCPQSNTITCDRVSVAVWPEGHPSRVIVHIAGRRIAMTAPATNSNDGYWQGTLRHAGLLRPGPLEITPDSGRATWAGRHPRPLVVRITAVYPGRQNATGVMHVLLRPGWG